MKRTHILTEADVTPESIFNLRRRQVLKALGLGAAAASLPGGAQADVLSWFKGNDRPPAPAGRDLQFSKPMLFLRTSLYYCNLHTADRNENG